MTEKDKKMTVSALRETFPQNAPLNDALDEIMRVAAALEIDVSRWDIIKMFGIENPAPGACPIETDPVKIEQIVREKSKRPAVSVETAADSAEINETIVAAISELYAAATRNKAAVDIRALNDNVAYYMRNVNELVTNTWRQIAELTKVSAQLSALQEKMEPNEREAQRTRAQLLQLHRAGFWTDFRMDGSGFWARTANPLVLSERNIPAGIDRHLSAGYYAVRLVPATSLATAFPCGGNKVTEHRGYYQTHPHIWNDGKICLGHSESSRFMEAAKQLNFAAMLVAVQAALSGYNNADAYVPLDKLEKGADYAKKVQEGLVVWYSPYGDVLAPKKEEVAAEKKEEIAVAAAAAAPEVYEGERVRD